MTTATTEASSIMKDADLSGVSEINEVVDQAYKQGVRENMGREYVTMYHPDGTTSLVQLPPPSRTRGYADARQKLLHYIMNKRGSRGEQWWFASPPSGWTPAELPYRCFVSRCTRTGGFSTLEDVLDHAEGKHPREWPRYRKVVDAMQNEIARLAMERTTDQLNLPKGTEISESNIHDVLKGKASKVVSLDPYVPDAGEFMAPETTEGWELPKPAIQCECGWAPEADKKNPEQALAMHKRRWCKGKADDTQS